MPLNQDREMSKHLGTGLSNLGEEGRVCFAGFLVGKHVQCLLACCVQSMGVRYTKLEQCNS